MNMIAKKDLLPAEPVSETAAILSMISRAAADPNVDIDKMERLMRMRNDAQALQTRAEFSDALADLQSELPSIKERGDAAGRYKFALWEDINEAIKPILKKHGFALSFRTDTANGVTVTGVLSHRNGHREETSITLPADPSGNKNAVQAVASSVSYGKRYSAGALLNLTSYGEDDDGFSAAVSYDITTWADAIKDATDKTELDRIAADLKANKAIPPKALTNIRALWSAKAKELVK